MNNNLSPYNRYTSYTYHQQPQMNHQQPQMTHQQPQMSHQQPQMNHYQPEMHPPREMHHHQPQSYPPPQIATSYPYHAAPDMQQTPVAYQRHPPFTDSNPPRWKDTSFFKQTDKNKEKKKYKKRKFTQEQTRHKFKMELLNKQKVQRINYKYQLITFETRDQCKNPRCQFLLKYNANSKAYKNYLREVEDAQMNNQEWSDIPRVEPIKYQKHINCLHPSHPPGGKCIVGTSGSRIIAHAERDGHMAADGSMIPYSDHLGDGYDESSEDAENEHNSSEMNEEANEDFNYCDQDDVEIGNNMNRYYKSKDKYTVDEPKFKFKRRTRSRRTRSRKKCPKKESQSKSIEYGDDEEQQVLNVISNDLSNCFDEEDDENILSGKDSPGINLYHNHNQSTNKRSTKWKNPKQNKFSNDKHLHYILHYVLHINTLHKSFCFGVFCHCMSYKMYFILPL